MKTLILPTKTHNSTYIDIGEVSHHDLIMVYNNDELIGICLYNIETEYWYLQTEAGEDGLLYQSDSLYDLVITLQKYYKNLKILVK